MANGHARQARAAAKLSTTIVAASRYGTLTISKRPSAPC